MVTGITGRARAGSYCETFSKPEVRSGTWLFKKSPYDYDVSPERDHGKADKRHVSQEQNSPEKMWGWGERRTHQGPGPQSSCPALSSTLPSVTPGPASPVRRGQHRQ